MCSWKHLFLELDVVGDCTVGRDSLIRVRSEEMRRWESLLEKGFLESNNNLREGNSRAPVKKGVSLGS